MLKANNLQKRYHDLQVLKGVNLQVQAGEIVSVVGASGAGKSTLLHILGTLDRADSGDLELQGQSLANFSDEQMAQFRNQHIGFVFQFHNLLPEFTALENVCLPAWIAKKDFAETNKKALNLLDRLGISDRKDHKPAQLSGGEQQRFAVARALINSPKIVFADEPSGNLDSKNAEELHQLFFDLRAELKQTFVIVTHNPTLATMADRMIEMVDGRIKI
ncbi:MAG: ABC transporter ATP-binding protein [Bacteroidetes bacterium]|nr:MAG: ABC transporter ATP-binding protein [Bacteroidota bacterium]